MPLDSFKNLAYSLVATAPAPADTGTSLVVTAGQGTRFPTAPFNATIWPADTIPTPANAEIVRVTVVSTDTLTITRAQEGTTARSVIVGDQIAATITALTLSTLETDISVVSVAVTSVDTHAAAASAAATSADAHAATASAAATSADGHANAVSVALAALSLNVSAISTALSNELSVRAASVQTASAAATSADAHANAASAAATSVLAGISAVSALSDLISIHGLQSVVNALSSRISAALALATDAEAAALAASAAATSADTHAATASAAATSADAHANAVSAVLAVVSAVSAGGTAVGLQSVINALSNRISAIPGGGSAADRKNFVSIAQSVAASTMASGNISGLTMSVSAGGLYQVESRVMVNRANTSTIARFGLVFPAMKRVRGAINVMLSAAKAQGTVSTRFSNHPFTGNSASGSVIASIAASSITFLSTMAMLSGTFFVSTGGTITPRVAGSATGGNGLTILEGSYIRAIRIN